MKPAEPVLTQRESEVLALMCKGFAGNEAARLLGVSPFTLRDHQRSIREKLGVSTQAEAAYVAGKSGFVA